MEILSTLIYTMVYHTYSGIYIVFPSICLKNHGKYCSIFFVLKSIGNLLLFLKWMLKERYITKKDSVQDSAVLKIVMTKKRIVLLHNVLRKP